MAIRLEDTYQRIFLPSQEENLYPSEDDVAIKFAQEQEESRETARSSLVQDRGWGCTICLDVEEDAFLPCGHGGCLDCLTRLARKTCTTCRRVFTQADIRQIVDNDNFKCGICDEPAYLPGLDDKGPPVLSTLCGRITVQHPSHPEEEAPQQDLGVRVGHLFHQRCYRERVEREDHQHECPSCSPEQRRAARAPQQPDLGLPPQLDYNAPVFGVLREVPPVAYDNVLEDVAPVLIAASYALLLIASVFDSDFFTLIGFEALFIGATQALLSIELYGMALTCASVAALVFVAVANMHWLVTPLLYTAGAGIGFEAMRLVPLICEEIIQELWR